MKIKPRTVIIFTLFLLCSLAWCATSYAEAVRKDDKDRDSTIVFGYTPILFHSVDPRDATEIMESWSRITERKLGMNWKLSTIAFKTFSDAERALKNKDVDILVMIPEEYLNLRANSLVTPILSAEYNDKFYSEHLLLVRKDSGITGIEQLRGKKILIDNGQQGTIPIKWLDSLLAKQTLSKGQEFFGRIGELTKGNKVILPVFFHQVDACIVSRRQFETMAELNPQIGQQLMVLVQSPGFATGIIAMRKDAGDLRRDAVFKSLLEIHLDPRGKQIMTLFRIKRLIPYLPEHLVTVEKLIKDRRGKSDSVAIQGL